MRKLPGFDTPAERGRRRRSSRKIIGVAAVGGNARIGGQSHRPVTRRHPGESQGSSGNHAIVEVVFAAAGMAFAGMTGTNSAPLKFPAAC